MNSQYFIFLKSKFLPISCLESKFQQSKTIQVNLTYIFSFIYLFIGIFTPNLPNVAKYFLVSMRFHEEKEANFEIEKNTGVLKIF